MQLLIDVPPMLQSSLQWLQDSWHTLSTSWHHGLDAFSKGMDHVYHIPRHAVVPLTVFVLLFWPVVVSLIMTLATAWTWIFWLFTSILFGCIQLLYASYQFLMIAGDISGLSLLKTYSMVRSQILWYVDKTVTSTSTSSSNSNSTATATATSSRRRYSRRRIWGQRVDQAESYEDFLKIRLELKDPESVILVNSLSSSSSTTNKPDAALPRRQSFSVDDSPTSNHSSSSAAAAASAMRRTFSFGDDKQKRNIKSPLTLASTVMDDTNSTSSSSTSLITPITQAELGERTVDLLVTTTNRVRQARHTAQRERTDTATHALVYLLSGVMKRNHLNLDDIAVTNARSIAESGMYGLTAASRSLIRSYYDEIERGLDWLAESALACDPPSPESSPSRRHNTTTNTTLTTNTDSNNNNHDSNDTNNHTNSPIVQRSESATSTNEMKDPIMARHDELVDRISLVRKMKQNMGRTALMLSGGGAQAMYHLGVIRALIESKQYNDIKVISGTSGGSISAGMCATMTAEELYKDVCVDTVSTDFKRTGEQKAKNIRWFPSITEMAAYWFKHKLMVDNAMFRRTCEFYYADITFEEAFERTGKHVCITVSASRVSGDSAQRLLLNHISTPHVTIASAVAASCALPGVMAPAKLIAKNGNGELEPFEVDGVEWIDGSVQADLPFQRISTLFSVTSFIVSQTNFHIIPFLNKAHHPNQKSLYWTLFQTIEWDIRNRALKLSRLGLFPRIFGQDISKVFKQRYHGNLTIVPRFTTMQTFGLQALSNPTVEDMKHYLKYGQIATWPYLNAIRDMIRLEKALDDCLCRLEDRLRTIDPDADWFMNDEVESIASSSAPASLTNRVRIVGRPPMGLSIRDREAERLRRRVTEVEEENHRLRKQLDEMKRQLSGKGDERKTRQEQDESAEQTASSLPVSDGVERGVWGLVLRKNET